MAYKYIAIQPMTANISVVIDEQSDYNQGVALETNLANAAPELLEALQYALKFVGAVRPGAVQAQAARDKARAAIAKAING